MAYEIIREFRGPYETFRMMNSSLNLTPDDDYLSLKGKRMRVIELNQILE